MPPAPSHCRPKLNKFHFPIPIRSNFGPTLFRQNYLTLSNTLQLNSGNRQGRAKSSSFAFPRQ
ncbi:hypothetical protein BURPS305_1477 [Burkholderia pseudomallei 305]|nr:hypothetical protein BURPS305_1477 [Burkholderia pseudomallei 305]